MQGAVGSCSPGMIPVTVTMLGHLPDLTQRHQAGKPVPQLPSLRGQRFCLVLTWLCPAWLPIFSLLSPGTACLGRGLPGQPAHPQVMALALVSNSLVL